MSFRSLEINKPSELHIHHHVLEIQQEDQILHIPVDDCNVIIASGPDVRLSANDLSVLAESDVLFMTIDNHYLPSSMTLSFANNVRQARTMKKQLTMSRRRRNNLWDQLICAKIRNQSAVLYLLQRDGSQEIYDYAGRVNRGDRDHIEALAANRYFQYYHPGLNRRCDDPVNSCLNYGYTILRSAVARSAAAHGFLLSEGIFHHNTFNSFNLVDDLIEPFRPIADLQSAYIVSNQVRLSREQRRKLMGILYLETRINGEINTVLQAIDIMVNSVKSYMYSETDEILVPELLPINEKGGISE